MNIGSCGLLSESVEESFAAGGLHRRPVLNLDNPVAFRIGWTSPRTKHCMDR